MPHSKTKATSDDGDDAATGQAAHTPIATPNPLNSAVLLSPGLSTPSAPPKKIDLSPVPIAAAFGSPKQAFGSPAGVNTPPNVLPPNTKTIASPLAAIGEKKQAQTVIAGPQTPVISNHLNVQLPNATTIASPIAVIRESKPSQAAAGAPVPVPEQSPPTIVPPPQPETSATPAQVYV